MPSQQTGGPDTITPSDFTPLGAAPAAPGGKRHPLRITVACGLALFAAALVFLLGARSVHIDIASQTAADSEIGGPALPFGRHRYLLWPGEYALRVSAEGYLPLQTTITVDDRDSQNVPVTLEALPGLLSITSEPAGASVIIDGEARGETPLTDLPVPMGEYPLTVQAPRYRTVTQTLDITGRGVRQSVGLTLAPAWAVITLDSLPAGAQILVDGETQGSTPARLELLEGERELQLQLPAHAPFAQTLSVTAGEAQDLGVITLARAPGELVLESSPAGANVTLNGEFQGQTPLTLALPPGRDHRLAVFKPGYQRHSETLRLPAGASEKRQLRLRALLGEVRLRVTPENALVQVNGRAVGRGSRTLSLPAVAHSIEVSLEGYATQRQRVTPRTGLAQQLDITLLTQQQARTAGVPAEITTALGQTLRLFKPEESELADFSMGASRRDPGRRANEVLHPVSLRRMFYVQTTEVTNAQFRQFQGGHNSGQISGQSLNRDHQPVVQVSWQQAAAFCNWLSRREGLAPFYREQQGIITGFDAASTGYRLPSEAEWAWVARANGSRLLTFPWGDSFPPTQAVENYADTSSAFVTGRVLNNYSDGQVVSATVGAFPPNHNGLFDLGGNVAEWVHDVYRIPTDDGRSATDPLGTGSGDNYVISGASWTRAKLAELRLSHRDYGQAGRDDVGFRIARYAE
ncbi:MAG: PEGA domain-containing protein [Halioglobus sp.]|nr:PEGA domain-containing protein [Halioglobus sp.]